MRQFTSFNREPTATARVKSRATLAFWFQLLLLTVLASVPKPIPALAEERESASRPDNHFDGLGLELKSDKGSLLVVKVIAGSPAARAFIQPGDRIVSIDGRPVADMSAEYAASRLRGKAGTYVNLTVSSGKETPRGLRIRRGEIGERKSDLAASEKVTSRLLQRLKQLEGAETFQRRIDAQFERLRDPLFNEVHFMAKVGHLTPSETESLKNVGEQTIIRHLGPTTSGAAGRLVRREVVVVNGRGEVREELNEPPPRAVRRELAPVLRSISQQAWEQFESERERLDRRRKHAEILAQVAAFDEALLLTREQREKFCNLLSARWTDVWRGRINENSGADPARLCLTAVGAMGFFSIPDVELAAALRPDQVAAFKLVQLPTQEEIVALQAAAAPVARNNAAIGAQVGVRVVVQQAEVERKVVRQGLLISELRQRLESLLERFIDDAEDSCALSEAQKQTLLLAGKLDLDRYFQQHAESTAKPQPGQQVVLMHRQIAGANVRLPDIFSEGSFFQKALHSRLSAEQLEDLAGAQRERARFAQQMVLENLVVALAEPAALTSEQCERLETALAPEIVPTNSAANPSRWRRETLHRISELAIVPLQPLFEEWQWPSAREYLDQLADTARRLETQPEEPLAMPAGGGGMF